MALTHQLAYGYGAEQAGWLPLLAGGGTDVLGGAAPLARNEALAQTALPFPGHPEFMPHSRRPALEQIKAIGVCREGNPDRAVIKVAAPVAVDQALKFELETCGKAVRADGLLGYHLETYKDQAGGPCVWAIERTLLPAASPAHENQIAKRRHMRLSKRTADKGGLK